MHNHFVNLDLKKPFQERHPIMYIYPLKDFFFVIFSVIYGLNYCINPVNREDFIWVWKITVDGHGTALRKSNHERKITAHPIRMLWHSTITVMSQHIPVTFLVIQNLLSNESTVQWWICQFGVKKVLQNCLKFISSKKKFETFAECCCRRLNHLFKST
jgi:hypothetical protein